MKLPSRIHPRYLVLIIFSGSLLGAFFLAPRLEPSTQTAAAITPNPSPEPSAIPQNSETEADASPSSESLPQEPTFDFSDPSQLQTSAGDILPDGLHLMVRFTTHYSCCGARVQNIQKMADLVDQTIIPSGAEFSLNHHVGERTEEKGFLPAGTIMAGELVDTIGGGVSQFATTLYNATYWAGLQDITHKPHSWSFSRYPTGIEATISWPSPDLIFKNTTDHPIIIHTSYTDTSVSVELWGYNDGRSLAGEHIHGETTIETLAAGGDSALIVTSTSTLSEEKLSDIPILVYPNTAIRPGFSIEMNPGSPGKIMYIHRTRSRQGQDLTDTWKVVYKPIPQEIHVHPCMLPEAQRTHAYEKYDYSSVDCSDVE